MMVCTQSFYSSLLRFLSHAGWNNVALFVPRMNAKMGLYIKAWCAPRLQINIGAQPAHIVKECLGSGVGSSVCALIYILSW